jgi:hypothetical protein
MDGKAARVAASESGDERVQSLNISVMDELAKQKTVRDVSTSLDMTEEGVGNRPHPLNRVRFGL